MSARATFFAFRAPALPMDVLTGWADGVEAPTSPPDELEAALTRDRERLTRRLHDIVQRPAVTAAIAVASPDLLDAWHDREHDPGVEAALVRYVSRMASRPTPFGLFAACGAGEIADRTRIALPDPTTWRRHSRLDGDYLDRVVRARAAALRPCLTFRPNDSLYAVGARRRYVQTRLDGVERTHHLTEITDSPHLHRAIAAATNGAKPSAIAEAVAAPGAARYVDQLIDAQVLQPDLAVTITGPPPIDALIAGLAAAGDCDTATILAAVRHALAALDAGAGHDRLPGLLRHLPEPGRRAHLLQVDATIPDCGATLARETVDDIARGVELLRRIAPTPEPTELDRFRDAFLERYDGQEVPLLEALDDDLGVGFGAPGGDPAPLLKGISRPRAERRAPVDRREGRLLEVLHRAWAQNAHEVVLGPEDIAALERDDALPLPAATGAVVVLARTADGPRVVLSLASGPSGAALLGRFCHADAALAARVSEQLRAEEAREPDAIHAEIVHLPSGQLSNVLVRPVLREWELEWLGRSGAPADRRLPVSDLTLSVCDGRFVLRSRRLGQRVLPRLTSAHNWSRRSPAVYRFLAAMQSQGVAAGVEWSWAPFERVPFTPRVRWGRLVLSRARWWVARPELRELAARDPVARWRAVQAWRERRRLPRWICLVDGDNKLAIDLDNALSVDTLLRAVRSRDEALLEELYPGPDELVADGPDGKRALELVVPLLTPEPAAPGGHARPQHAAATVRRTFAPGSEWTYLKLYTGSATADALLRDTIGPLARGLIASGAADRWFFIRYGDPQPHLRIRLHGDPRALLEPVQGLAARALEAGLAHDAQVGTYRREVERYGGSEGIAIAEQLFHADSDAVVTLMDRFARGERGLDERWRIGVLGSDMLLRDLGLDDGARAAHARRLHAAFERELHADPRLRKAVAERARAERTPIGALLDAAGDDHPLAAGIAVLGERSDSIRPLAAELIALSEAGRLTVGLDALADAFVHMWLNRLCRSDNRLHEYVIYALLTRVLGSRAAARVACPS
ncbi:MAG: lantibiotic biosynthesis protein [Solirubrobacteraceae bacterium]|jgi:thiopeptide-type bacteriocin biosynthesis protein|nr:lantibiotic biosynthesis protein [Solirubrobacteraceae bacterium]